MKELEIRKRMQEEDEGRGGENKKREERKEKGERGEKERNIQDLRKDNQGSWRHQERASKSLDKSHGFVLKKGQR